MKRLELMKRTAKLFVYIKESNKKFVQKESKTKGMNNSQYIDALINRERKRK